jgi:hypothetical protein
MGRKEGTSRMLLGLGRRGETERRIQAQGRGWEHKRTAQDNRHPDRRRAMASAAVLLWLALALR